MKARLRTTRCFTPSALWNADAETDTFYLSDTFPADHHVVVCFASGLTLRLHAVEAWCDIQV